MQRRRKNPLRLQADALNNARSSVNLSGVGPWRDHCYRPHVGNCKVGTVDRRTSAMMQEHPKQRSRFFCGSIASGGGLPLMIGGRMYSDTQNNEHRVGDYSTRTPEGFRHQQDSLNRSYASTRLKSCTHSMCDWQSKAVNGDLSYLLIR